MRQQLRITYDEADYTYHIDNEAPINHATRELIINIRGEKLILVKDPRRIWIQKEGHIDLDPGLVQAIGRTVSLRYRF